MRSIRAKMMQVSPAVLLVLALAICAFGQNDGRLISWPPAYSTPAGQAAAKAISTSKDALQLVAVRVDGQPITIGREFTGDSEWIKSLTFIMKNVSGLPIMGVRMSLGLPETKNDRGQLALTLEYGNGLGTGLPADHEDVVQPDQEFEIRINDARYRAFKEFVLTRSGISELHRLLLGVTVVKFEDGTSWAGACLPVADAASGCAVGNTPAK